MTTERRVPIYDYHSRRRLLGHLANPPRFRGETLHLVTAAPTGLNYASSPSDAADLTYVRRVVLDLTEGETDYENWAIPLIFVTEAPLRDLLRVDGYRLPGENARMAEERRYTATYCR